MPQLFENQVAKTPNRIAVVCNREFLTYAELNQKSNQLANHLLADYRMDETNGSLSDAIIAICLDRSVEMIVSILAVLKTGAAYVPIDPEFPAHRKDFIITDTQAKYILTTQAHTCEAFSKSNPVFLDDIENDQEVDYLANLSGQAGSDSLAYIIYTSGTTGKPKGVMIEHKAVINTLTALDAVYTSPGITRTTAFTSYVFDVSVSEIFNSLLNGLELHILTGSQRNDATILSRYLIDSKINLVYLPPILLRQLPLVAYENLRTIIYAGEPCDSKTVELWADRVNLYNYYGPTEASIYATGMLMSAGKSKLIGKPVQNTRTYILNEEMKQVKDGEAGELYISGGGLARGYLNQPELTEKSFIANPFNDSDSNHFSRLYKTGDLVRSAEDGSLEFIGRNDDQVKLNGYRIELGEISNKLSQIKGIDQCCVILKEQTILGNIQKHIIGYYVTNKNLHSHLSRKSIENELQSLLPTYMIPSFLMEIDSLPMTINGKLDKSALPDISASNLDYVPPSTILEREMCLIWEAHLVVDRVGIIDDFFRIGGTSVLAIQLSGEIRKKLNMIVDVSDFFSQRTISNIIRECTDKRASEIPSGDSTNGPLSSAQERLWFLHQLEGKSNSYHLPRIYKIQDGTDLSGLKRAIICVVDRHEILRSKLTQRAGLGWQHISSDPIEVKEVATIETELDALLTDEINRPFDLSEEYPIRAVVYSLQNGSKYLLINTHHAASDGWSIELFHKELGILYNQLTGHTELTAEIQPLPIQYKDYALWQKGNTALFPSQLSFWKNKLEDFQSLALPYDKKRTPDHSNRGMGFCFEFDPLTSYELKKLARSTGVSLYSVMLSGVYILLGRYANQQDVVLGSPVANRRHHQLENLIGFFVNMVVNRCDLRQNESFQELILRVQEEQSASQNNQDVPFDRVLDELTIERQDHQHPVFQATFGMEPQANSP
ncbi:MAG: amino acid adenylation domain-containing protein, partial [Cyclobacteriaceae bacterium]